MKTGIIAGVAVLVIGLAATAFAAANTVPASKAKMSRA